MLGCHFGTARQEPAPQQPIVLRCPRASPRRRGDAVIHDEHRAGDVSARHSWSGRRPRQPSRRAGHAAQRCTPANVARVDHPRLVVVGGGLLEQQHERAGRDDRLLQAQVEHLVPRGRRERGQRLAQRHAGVVDQYADTVPPAGRPRRPGGRTPPRGTGRPAPSAPCQTSRAPRPRRPASAPCGC